MQVYWLGNSMDLYQIHKKNFCKYKLLIKPLRKLSGFFLNRRGLCMNRILTISLAIIVMGYSIYSWNDDSKQSMLILQLLLGFMLAGMGIQNVKKDEKENKKMGLLLLLTSLICIIVSVIKYLKQPVT